MASHLFKLHIQTFKTSNPSTPFPVSKTLFPSHPFPTKFSHNPKTFHLSLHASLSSSTPPASKEEAILQAKTCLSTTLAKPLNNPKLSGKLKKLKQSKFQLEIPVIDDAPESLSQLALDIFGDLAIKRKGSQIKILILWPNPISKNAAIKAFERLSLKSSNPIDHIDIPSVTKGDSRILNTAEVAVFLAPETSQLTVIKTVTDSLYPKPVVIFNPKWGFEEKSELGGLSDFVGSFEVIYSFMGLEVKGILSKRKGVVFRCVRDGNLSGEKWSVLVEEEGGELKVVSRFKARPSIDEVENVLYNLMAINSPITKSAKFFRDLVSNVTGKK